MGAIAYQITSLTIVYSTVYSGADQRKHQSFASLAFVWGIHRGPVNSPHKWLVTRKMFPFDDVIMNEFTCPNANITSRQRDHHFVLWYSISFHMLISQVYILNCRYVYYKWRTAYYISTDNLEYINDEYGILKQSPTKMVRWFLSPGTDVFWLNFAVL